MDSRLNQGGEALSRGSLEMPSTIGVGHTLWFARVRNAVVVGVEIGAGDRAVPIRVRPEHLDAIVEAIDDGDIAGGDGDGIADVIEAGGSDADRDAFIDDFADASHDGLAERLLSAPLPVPDNDHDGIADVLDGDADDDGATDVSEAGGTDDDGNGILDDATDEDGNGLADSVETDPLASRIPGGGREKTPSLQGDEGLDAETGLAKDGAQSAAIELGMVRDDELSEGIVPAQDDVAALLSFHHEPRAHEAPDALASGDPRQLAHTAMSTASKRSSGTGRSSWTRAAT